MNNRLLLTGGVNNMGDEDVVFIDEEGNVIESNVVDASTDKEKGATTAIRDNLGEFEENL